VSLGRAGPLRAERVVYTPCGVLILVDCGVLAGLVAEQRDALVVHGVEGGLRRRHVYVAVVGSVVYVCRSGGERSDIRVDVEAGELRLYPPALLD